MGCAATKPGHRRPEYSAADVRKSPRFMKSRFRFGPSPWRALSLATVLAGGVASSWAAAPAPAAQDAAVPPASGACAITGRVSARGQALPGVSVGRPGTPPLTSTDEDGRFRLPEGQAPARVEFHLSGFTGTTRDTGAGSAACVPLVVELELALAPPGAAPEDSSGATASAAGIPGARPALLGARAMTIDRGRLRDREVALRRGALAATSGDTSTMPTPGERAAGTQTSGDTPRLAAGSTPALAGAVPALVRGNLPVRPVLKGADRLYSATSSYTVAGSAFDTAPYQLRTGGSTTRPDYLRQSVDISLGGPLALPGVPGSGRKTNATLSYSAIRGENLFDQYATVPTLAMRAGDFSSLGRDIVDPATGTPFPGNRIAANRLDPSALALLRFIPLPTSDDATRNFHYTTTSTSTQDQLQLKLTHTLAGDPAPTGGRGAASRPRRDAPRFSAALTGQLEYRRSVNDRLNALPAIAGTGTNVNLRVPIGLTVTRGRTQHALNASLFRTRTDTRNRYAFTEDVAGAAGIAGSSRDPFDWGLPTLGFSTVTGVSDLTPSTRTDTRLTVGYSWARPFGTHRIRLGGEGASLASAAHTDQNARGAFVFTGAYSGTDVADFLLGAAQQASVQYGPGLVRLHARSLGLFVQDDWRRWSRVTLNLGVRYELQTPYADARGRMATLDVSPDFTQAVPVVAGGTGPFSGALPDALVHTDRNNVAPRVGVGVRVAPRTTLRGGYGVSYNTGSYAQIARQLATQPPFATTSTRIAAAGAPLPLSNAFTQAEATTNTFAVSPGYEAGRVGTWNLNLGRDIGDAWNVSADVTAARGSHLDVIRAPNRGPEGLRIAGVQPFLWQTAEGRSSLRSASLRLRRWYVRGFGTNVNYTVSRSMDDASTIGGGATVVAQDERNLAAEWGPSSFDRRHQLSGDVYLEFPFGPNRRWLRDGGVAAALLQSWSAYITFNLQSGTPLTPRVLGSASDVARGTNGTLRAQYAGGPIQLDAPTADRFFNTAAFAVPVAGTFGTAGRNMIVGPGSRDLGLQLTRDLPAGGRRSLSVQIRASNLLNLVNYAAVDAVVNSPTFGQVLSVRPLRSVQVNVRVKF